MASEDMTIEMFVERVEALALRRGFLYAQHQTQLEAGLCSCTAAMEIEKCGSEIGQRLRMIVVQRDQLMNECLP